jgi:hypothetical protein
MGEGGLLHRGLRVIWGYIPGCNTLEAMAKAAEATGACEMRSFCLFAGSECGCISRRAADGEMDVICNMVFFACYNSRFDLV